MKNLYLILILVCAAVITGCDSVKTEHLIGERIQEDLSKQFDGVWYDEDDESMHFYLHYLGNGELHVAFVEFETDKFELITFPLILTNCGANKFIHLPDQNYPEGNVSAYDFLYFSFTTANEFKVVDPKIERFEKAITEGKVLGEINKREISYGKGKIQTTIKITESGKSLCEFMQTRNIEEFFDLDGSRIFHKVKSVLTIRRTNPDSVHNDVPSE
jgi:hypothetical protein